MAEIKLRRGRPFKADAHFTHVGRASSSVYIAGMSNGMVKIGFSDNPRTRLGSLNSDSVRRFGCSVVHFHVYEGIGAAVIIPAACNSDSGRARAIEARCLNLLAAIGEPCAPSTEYFKGVDYFAAKALIDTEIFSLPRAA